MLSCDGRSCLLQMSLEHRQTALSSSGFFWLLLAIVGMPNCQEIPSQKCFAATSVMTDWAFPSECQGVFPQATCCSTAQLQRCVGWCSDLLIWCCWRGSTSRLLQGEYCSPDLIAYETLLTLQEERDLLAVDCDPCWHAYKGIFFTVTQDMLAWIPFCSIKLT